MAKTRAQQPTKPKPQSKGKGKARAAPTAAAPAPPVPSPKTRLSKATKTPLPRESSEDLQDKAADAATSDEDDEALDALLQGEDVEMDEGVALEGEDDSDEDDDSDDDDDEEEDDVTEEALERMMKVRAALAQSTCRPRLTSLSRAQLLGPVDAAELGLLDGEDEEEGSDDEEEGSEDDEEGEEEEEEAEDAELKPYEELDEVDPDVAPVEKNVTNDKVRHRSLLVATCRREVCTDAD